MVLTVRPKLCKPNHPLRLGSALLFAIRESKIVKESRKIAGRSARILAGRNLTPDVINYAVLSPPLNKESPGWVHLSLTN